MAEHGEVWNSISQARRDWYEKRAGQVRAHTQASLDEALVVAKERLSTTLADTADSKDGGGSMKLSLTHFSSTDMEKLDTLYGSDIFTSSVMREKRKQATSCPPPLSQQRFDTLVARSRLE
eukprot:5764751-Amphidinium_carterae.1